VVEVILGRVINTESAGKQRNLLLRSVVLALRELSLQETVSDLTRDLVAYLVLSLRSIADTIDGSVDAWEKRGYWLKADKFRLEWDWTEEFAASMEQALVKNDWQTVAIDAAQIAQKLNGVSLPKRHRLGAPWEGAWKKLMNL
jgi:hypothetical protein